MRNASGQSFLFLLFFTDACHLLGGEQTGLAFYWTSLYLGCETFRNVLHLCNTASRYTTNQPTNTSSFGRLGARPERLLRTTHSLTGVGKISRKDGRNRSSKIF